MTFKTILTLLTLFLSPEIFPCTTAVVSGKCTVDGRPLLYKHRDTGYLNNKVVYIKGEKYNFLAVVNSCNVLGDTVWMGTNSAGFSIMNSASYNINDDDSLYPSENEGVIMKRALELCASLLDFEQFLDTLTRPMRVGSNFGVIDSYDGAAYYETGNWGYTKFDANNPEVAPNGYLIRTNYSVTGKPDKGHGYIRHETISELFAGAYTEGSIDENFILKKVDRCLINSLTKTDYSTQFPEDNSESKIVAGIDLVQRNSSASTFLCKGVKEGENPSLSVMWVILGYQLCTPAIPLWIGAKENIPSVLIGCEKSGAPLCTASLELKKKIYPIIRGHGSDYIDLTQISNKKNTGIYQKTKLIEDGIFSRYQFLIKVFSRNGFNLNTVKEFYSWVNEFVKSEYSDKFNVRL